jgi:hypothetical protein
VKILSFIIVFIISLSIVYYYTSKFHIEGIPGVVFGIIIGFFVTYTLTDIIKNLFE